MTTFYRLLGFLRPYKRGLAISWVLASAAMVMTVLLPGLTGAAVEAINKGASHAAHHQTALRDEDRETLLLIAAAILAAALVRWGLTYWRRMIAGRVSLGIEYDLRDRLYRHMQRLELGFFDRQQTGQLMSRATVDLAAVRFFLGYGLVFILQFALTILLAGVAMMIINPSLGLIALAPVPFVVVISYRYGRKARPAIQEVQQRIGELTANAEENISGVRVVKSFAREPRQLARFSQSTTRVFEQSMVATRQEARYNPIIGFLPQLGLTAVLLIGGERVIHASLTLGQFSAFYFYLNMLVGPMRSLGMTLNLAQRATASGARIFQLLDRDPRMTEAPGAPDLPAGSGHVQLLAATLRYDSDQELVAPTLAADGQTEIAATATTSAGTMTAAHAVTAAQVAATNGHVGKGSVDHAQTRAVLSDVDLDVPAGHTVALVGATGSGKTSLVSLISRLYDVSSGKVLLDGADVRDVSLRSLRQAIAVVSDDPFLFSATVAENIAYARPQASREEIETAAVRAQAHEFVERLPQGYDTRVGERGLTLSGGQRQRLAIARALLANPRVLILDDATSSVDASTEQSIKLALAEAMAGRTTFVIAHRLSTIALADEIAVIDHGKVVAYGSHHELLTLSPLYREIVEKGLPESVFMTKDTCEREVSSL
ncbi:MAG TPA: ABC transporter ATP-binding protein [Solirubrobacteraceae bacterium]|jgi:ATP-binding cassette subfamily B protein|nr:ABC transporter ATP-binding protein [Solirubrobacteraceae bacterium]